jgi:hypothetical protein
MIMERVERSCLGFGLQFRELKLNEALREVCVGWAGCRFDGGHTYRFRFTRAMFSRLDYSTRACSARPPSPPRPGACRDRESVMG